MEVTHFFLDYFVSPSPSVRPINVLRSASYLKATKILFTILRQYFSILAELFPLCFSRVLKIKDKHHNYSFIILILNVALFISLWACWAEVSRAHISKKTKDWFSDTYFFMKSVTRCVTGCLVSRGTFHLIHYTE